MAAAVGRRRGVLSLLLGAWLLGLLCEELSAFLPAAGRSTAGRAAGPGRRAGEKESDPEYTPYDWQKVADGKGQVGGGSASGKEAVPDIDLSGLPDLPDIPEEGEVSNLGTKVKTREVSLPEIPGDPDLLPPEPNPIISAGLGLFEWTGIWILLLGIFAAVGGGFSFVVARAKMEPAFADKALSFTKLFLTVFEVLFLGRVLLTQFPKIKTTEFPWALSHYPTEWLLAPTRAVFKPEAGVDIAPLLWLIFTLLAAELLTGPAGILLLARDSPGNMPPGFG